jgi:hypothetical protein
VWPASAEAVAMPSDSDIGSKWEATLNVASGTPWASADISDTSAVDGYTVDLAVTARAAHVASDWRTRVLDMKAAATSRADGVSPSVTPPGDVIACGNDNDCEHLKGSETYSPGVDKWVCAKETAVEELPPRQAGFTTVYGPQTYSMPTIAEAPPMNSPAPAPAQCSLNTQEGAAGQMCPGGAPGVAGPCCSELARRNTRVKFDGAGKLTYETAQAQQAPKCTYATPDGSGLSNEWDSDDFCFCPAAAAIAKSGRCQRRLVGETEQITEEPKDQVPLTDKCAEWSGPVLEGLIGPEDSGFSTTEQWKYEDVNYTGPITGISMDYNRGSEQNQYRTGGTIATKLGCMSPCQYLNSLFTGEDQARRYAARPLLECDDVKTWIVDKYCHSEPPPTDGVAEMKLRATCGQSGAARTAPGPQCENWNQGESRWQTCAGGGAKNPQDVCPLTCGGGGPSVTCGHESGVSAMTSLQKTACFASVSVGGQKHVARDLACGAETVAPNYQGNASSYGTTVASHMQYAYSDAFDDNHATWGVTTCAQKQQ